MLWGLRMLITQLMRRVRLQGTGTGTPTGTGANTGVIGTPLSTEAGSNATDLDKTLQKVNPITQVMLTFVTAFSKTQNFFSGYAMGLIGILATIDLTWTTLSNLENGDHIQETLKKVVKYGFFVWLITNYTKVLVTIMQGFVWIGYKAGVLGVGNPVLTIRQVINPEAIFYSGANIAMPILSFLGGPQRQIGDALATRSFWPAY